MDGRTRESRLIRSGVGEGVRNSYAEHAMAQYIRADRCRICGLDSSDRHNAATVQITIDEALMNGSTYREAIEAVEPFVAEWPPEELPTYAAVRNHAKKHLKRDEALIRQVVESHAIRAGIDVEDGVGSILTPGGIFGLIAQKGYERLRDGDAVPTVGETIQASRALAAIDDDQREQELERERLKNQALVAIINEIAPGTLEAITGSMPELSGKADDVVVIPDAGAEEPSEEVAEDAGFACGQCPTVAKTRRGLLQHTRRKHPEGELVK